MSMWDMLMLAGKRSRRRPPSSMIHEFYVETSRYPGYVAPTSQAAVRRLNLGLDGCRAQTRSPASTIAWATARRLTLWLRACLRMRW